MNRKTHLTWGGVALATTMLASVAHADDNTNTTQTSGPMTTPPMAPIPGQPQIQPTPSGGMVNTTMQSTTSTVTTPTVGTTQTTAAVSPAITGGGMQMEPERDTVTVYRKTRPNVPMLVTGGTLLLGAYVPTAVIGGSSDRNADKNLYIPVVGPWLNLADRQCSGCDNETRNVALVITSGIVQGLGAGLTLASFLVPQKVAAATITAGNVKMNVVPTQMGRDGAGVGAVGTF